MADCENEADAEETEDVEIRCIIFSVFGSGNRWIMKPGTGGIIAGQ